MKQLTVGIVAHVDSGKTTLSEALLYKQGAIRSLGRVDHKNTYLDSYELERQRGITIFSKQALFNTSKFNVTLIDTPGHVDFSGETERTFSVLDLAVILVSASGGVQSHTQTLWQLLRKNNIPTIIFVNKMDMPNADKETLLYGIHKKLSVSAIDALHISNNEETAICSEELMDRYLDSGISEADIQKAFKNCHLFPVLFGSALLQDGVDELIKAIDNFTTPPEYNETFGAKVYKIAHDDKDGRVSFMKITGGSISVKDSISYIDKDGQQMSEKITGIRIYQGDKFTNVSTAVSGQICGVTGLSGLIPGCSLGFEIVALGPSLLPVLNYKVIFPKQIDSHTMLSKLRVLEVEDPLLKVTANEASGEISLQLMGEIQLETVKYQVKERFGIDIDFSDADILYMETIENEVEGIGHYEPLRHYSEVHLLLTPLERGSGLVFDSLCDTDDLEKNWQRLIITHLEEKTHLGVLTGSPITDMRISLVSGKAHKKHTEGGDFRQSTYRAVRQGLMKAKSVLLEPWYEYKIEVPTECLGRVMTDMERMSATISDHQIDGNEAEISGECPVSEMTGYIKDFISFTHGKGRISFNFCGYDVCHNTSEVLQNRVYFPESDLDNSPDSIFCSGGAAVFVPWNEVEAHMHLPSIFSINKQEIEQRKEIKRRAENYIARAATDKELMDIFERTYGKVKPKTMSKTKIIGAPKQVKAPKQKPSHAPKGPEYLLIDGYNIIFAWDELKKEASSNLEHARKTLTDRLCNYQGFYGGEIILVFDAYKVHKNPGTIEDFRNIKVVYTKEAETADTYIERTAHKLSRDHIVRVATSDGPEQMIILGSGALRVPAMSFIKEVMDAEKAIRDLIE